MSNELESDLAMVMSLDCITSSITGPRYHGMLAPSRQLERDEGQINTSSGLLPMRAILRRASRCHRPRRRLLGPKSPPSAKLHRGRRRAWRCGRAPASCSDAFRRRGAVALLNGTLVASVLSGFDIRLRILGFVSFCFGCIGDIFLGGEQLYRSNYP